MPESKSQAQIVGCSHKNALFFERRVERTVDVPTCQNVEEMVRMGTSFYRSAFNGTLWRASGFRSRSIL